MESVDAVVDYARGLDATLRCYERQLHTGGDDASGGNGG